MNGLTTTREFSQAALEEFLEEIGHSKPLSYRQFCGLCRSGRETMLPAPSIIRKNHIIAVTDAKPAYLPPRPVNRAESILQGYIFRMDWLKERAEITKYLKRFRNDSRVALESDAGLLA